MMSAAVVVAVVLAVVVCAAAVPKEALVFSDEFDTLDVSRWKPEITLGGGGNWEFEYYSNNRSNSYVSNGVLYLKATLTEDRVGVQNLNTGYTMSLWGSQPADMCTGHAFYGCERTSGAGGNIINPIQSARLRTAESFSFKYGRMEIRAKLPKGDWLWPAIWMLPRHNQYGDWPASGEIDIVESRGNAPGYSAGGVDQIGSTLHWGPFYGQDPYMLTHATVSLKTGTFADDFHIFGVVWDETGITTYLDDPSQVILNVPFNTSFWQKGGFDKTKFDNPWAAGSNAAPFDQEYFIVFDLACGGTGGYFPDGVGAKPWTDKDNHAVNAFYSAKGAWYQTWTAPYMAIDYVRVYQSSPSSTHTKSR